MDSKEPMAVTDATFEEEVEKSSLPVLLDCWAPWCGPCLMLGPIIEQLAEAEVELSKAEEAPKLR